MSENTQAQQAEDLDAMGLIGHSYDSLFSIRKRIRKVNDLTIPFRQGLTGSQIGTGFLVFIIQIIIYGMLVVPAFGLFGASPPWQLMVVFIIGPAILAAQNIVKPMPYGKSIPGTLHSVTRGVLDDPIHRRGLPIATPKQPYEETLVHYQREWEAYEEFVRDEPWEAPVTDDVTEKRIRFCNQAAPDVDFQQWWDDKAAQHLEEEHRQRETAKDDAAQEIGARRGRATRVLLPEDISDTGSGR